MKTIDQLRTYFRIANIASDLVMAVSNSQIVTPLHQLYRDALDEIEREKPDMMFIDACIKQINAEMIKTAEPKLN